MRERLQALLTALGYPALRDLRPLHGHASYRTYHRAALADGTSLIVMAMPAGPASAAEEVTNFHGTMAELPFVNVARTLAEAGLPVPRVLHYSADDHWLLLEDLGDTRLEMRVRDADVATQRTWYRQAIDLMIRLQQKTALLRADRCIALQRSYDERLLNWEFDHFLEYGITARLGRAMDEKMRKAFTDQTRRITNAIVEMSYGFTHRDFQSRNLMVRDDRLYLLDFQDALRGPYIFDCVALLRDSYITLSPELVEELIAYFAAQSGRDPVQARLDFHRITVQRKLKDAGRFVYIDRVKGNPDFLPFIPASLQYVRSALTQIPEGPALFELLRPHVPEWL